VHEAHNLIFMNDLIIDPSKMGYTNTSGINFPIQGYTTLGNLVLNGNNTNRQIYDKHVDGMTGKIREFGFLDSIKVFPMNSDGKYEVAEAQHRGEALSAILSDKASETVVPISILHWIDPTDQEEIQNTILALNIGNKNWTIFDFVKSNANIKSKPNHKDFGIILNSMKDKKDILSNNLIAQIYSGQLMTHDALRDGTWVMRKEMESFYDLLIDNLSTFVGSKGKENVPILWLRFLINGMHKVNKSIMALKDDKNTPRLNTLNKILQRALNEAGVVINLPNAYLPTEAASFNPWFQKVYSEYISIEDKEFKKVA